MIYDLIIEEDNLVYDVGANIGGKTKLLLDRKAKIICIEPQYSCIKKLEEEYGDSVVIVNKALGSKIGIEEIWIASESTLSTFSEDFIKETKKERFKNYNWIHKMKVEMTTLDELTKIYGKPNFCKIDVEGYEYEVLKGLTKPINYISIEFTPELKEKTFLCIEYLLELDNNYLFNYSEGESIEFSFDNWKSASDIINFLKSINDRVTFGDLYAYLK